MAALPYMQLYVADYLADTAHLTAAQHGAYLLLIFNYWQRGKPLNNSNERLTNVARMTNDEWAEAKPILSEFFEIDGDEWVHARIERDLLAVNSKSGKASEAGKASAARRAEKKAANVQRTLNHTDTDTDTDTEEKQKQTPRASRFDAQAHLVESGIPPDLASDWIKLRKAKKAEVTKTAIAGIQAEAVKANLSLDAALRECCARGWAGFKASWLEREHTNPRASPATESRQAALERRNAEVAANWVPPELRGANDGRVIDAG